jgi:GxxExxY protein
MPEDKLLYRELTGAIIGAALEVHNVLRPGFLEAVYEEAPAHEFDLRGIAYERQKSFQVPYKTKAARLYRPDFVADGKVIVDAKAINKLTSLEEALILNYLKVTELRVGLTINFGELSLTHIRRVL